MNLWKKLKIPFVESQKEISTLTKNAISLVAKGKSILKEIQTDIMDMVLRSASR